jgi:hypothetical protein
MSWIKSHVELQKFFPFKTHEISQALSRGNDDDVSGDSIWPNKKK